MFDRLLHTYLSRVARALLLGTLAFALLGAAQTTTQAAAEPSLSQEELDALLAPIALYPDGLLSQVLMASTYPLEVVQAERFVKQNPELRGDALDEALAKKNWDPSVQSLAAYPKVLIMMSERLEWTERLGSALLEDQGRVMDTVQSLRKRAEQAGNLKSTIEHRVVHEKETIVIEPSQKETVYVYEYDPAWVYGAYWYAAASYYYDRYYGRYSYSVGASYSSYRISGNHWGWARADWHDRHLSVDGRDNRFWNAAAREQMARGAWQHDASHRAGAGYPTAAMRDRFDAVRAPSQPLANGGVASLRSMPSGVPPGFGGDGMPSFGAGGPPSFASGLPAGGFHPPSPPPRPPGPPGPH